MTKRPLIIAHRGASAHAPENTMPAFERAMRDHADGVEFDVWRCASGEVVVTHNRNLKALTGREGNVEKWPLKKLKALDFGAFKGNRFRGEKIPTLDQVLDLTRELAIINIEIKGIAVRSTGVELAVAEAILRFGLLRKAVVSSFNPAILLRLQQLNPAIRRGLLIYDRSPLTLRRYWSAPMLRTFSIHPSVSLLKRPKVEQAHQKRQLVYSWTVNNFQQLETCITLGVDGMMTDDPAWMHAALHRPSL